MIMGTIQIQIVHIFREVNQLDNCITIISINQENTQQYHIFQDLHSSARMILNMAVNSTNNQKKNKENLNHLQK